MIGVVKFPYPDTTKMKKIILALALSGAALAQSPDYPVVYSAAAGGPVPNPAYRPAAAQPAASPAYQSPYQQDVVAPYSRYSGDFLVGYGFRAAPDSKYATNIVSCELEGAYSFTPQHALTLSIGLAGGGETNDYWVREEHHHHSDWEPFTDSYDRLSFTVMAGYRFTQPISRRVSLQLGAKCGMDVQTLDVDYGYGWSGPYSNYRDGKSDTSVGMAYAGYANILFHITTRSDFVVGYRYFGSTAKPSPCGTGDPDFPRFRSRTMRWHVVHLGAVFRF